MKVRVHYLDGTTMDAVVGSREQVALERKYQCNYPTVFDPDKGRVEWVYFLCWSALHNAGEKVGDDFDVWLGLVQDAEPLVEDGARPTKRGRPRATSST